MEAQEKRLQRLQVVAWGCFGCCGSGCGFGVRLWVWLWVWGQAVGMGSGCGFGVRLWVWVWLWVWVQPQPAVLLTLCSPPQDAVLAAKARLAAHLHDCEEQKRRTREQKEAALERLQQLKNELSRAQARAQRRLAELTAQSGAALRALGKIVAKVGSQPDPAEPHVADGDLGGGRHPRLPALVPAG